MTIGTQQAARSAIEWVIHDIDHPVLGPIRYAAQKDAITTTVNDEKIVSLAFVSCQKSSRTIAIELTNAAASNPAGGLMPAAMPRLVCGRPAPGAGLAKSDLAARWEIRPLGDMLARGLSPSELRRCASIDVLQSVLLPPGSPRMSQSIAMDISPYDRVLDSVFSACGETSASASTGKRSPAAPPGTRQEPSSASGPAAPSAGAAWKSARTTTKNRTIVRAAARLDSAIVIKLAPGTPLLVQQTSTPWWKVKPRSGAGFSGFVREDRLVIE